LVYAWAAHRYESIFALGRVASSF